MLDVSLLKDVKSISSQASACCQAGFSQYNVLVCGSQISVYATSSEVLSIFLQDSAVLPTDTQQCYLPTLCSITYRHSAVLPTDTPQCYLPSLRSITYRHSAVLPTDTPQCYLPTLSITYQHSAVLPTDTQQYYLTILSTNLSQEGLGQFLWYTSVH
jgi:hypothetical protein